MKDYRLHIRVKNNYLLTAMERAGFWTAAELCRAFPELKQQVVGKALNLQLSLYNTRGATRPVWVKLSNALRCLPEDLLPPQHAESPLLTNAGNTEVSFDEIETFLPSGVGPALLPDDVIEQNELHAAIEGVLDTLTPREKKIVELRFGLNGEEESTYQVIADEFGLSNARTQQIEQKAIRKLKHPSRTRAIIGFVDPDPPKTGVFVADDPDYVQERLKREEEWRRQQRERRAARISDGR